MANPFSRLKFLPWGALFQVAGLATLILVAVEFLLYSSLVLISTRFLELGSILISLFSSLLFVLLIKFVVTLAYSMLAVYMLKRLFPQIAIDNSILWTLVLCLLVCLLVKLRIPLQHLLVQGFDGVELIGIIFGVFQPKLRFRR